MFGRLGFGEILLLLAIILVLFGAKKVPELGASIGKGIREFKRGMNDANRNLKEPDRTPRAEPPRTRDPATSPAEEARREPKRLL